jgi:homogentisate 1,2-dioxygenase
MHAGVVEPAGRVATVCAAHHKTNGFQSLSNNLWKSATSPGYSHQQQTYRWELATQIDPNKPFTNNILIQQQASISNGKSKARTSLALARIITGRINQKMKL